ncbi:hypothetical protein IFO69_04360 [Echinicola sp. CAU 1574]|uniref:Uncharacterized protein n=1 Tax=Echinicola arenosa TaxID=2774144 RepID=A0ABR9AGX4_9BACT|nr:hypothetical protein [Echinicola arenosa]MBD8487975.1 hypothetical protein [Echinicola arenosa]
MSSKIVLIVLGLFIVIAVMTLRPVPVVEEENALVEKGIVSYIFESQSNDIIFKLHENDKIFYINRGTKAGLDAHVLRKKLIGHEVILKYPKYWTPLDWDSNLRHLSKVEMGNEIVFNEFKN